MTKVDRTRIDAALAGAKAFPYWLDDTLRPEPEAKLIGVTTAGMAVVGGGFTGLWAAILTKEQFPKKDVVLIEADQVAFGASGRPGGIVSTSIMHGLKNAERVFPDDIAELERLGQENLDAFKATVEGHGIDADFEWNGEMTVAVSDADLPELREEFELHRRHGHDVEWLGAAETRAQLNSPIFKGAMWLHGRSGTVHPAKLAWGLKDLALSLGVRIYEKTPMERIEANPDALTIHTPEGEVRADRVFLATNAWAAGNKAIKRRVMTMRDHVFATEPLSQEQLARIGWQGRQGIYDTRTQLNYFRLTKDNRIVFGGSVSYHFGNDPSSSTDDDHSYYRNLVRDFFEKFPCMTDIKISHVWGGPIDYCTRFSVFFDRFHDDRAVYVGGYTGFGVSGTRFGARIGVALLTGSHAPELNLDIVRERPSVIPPEPFRWLGALVTLKVVQNADAKGGWRKGVIKLMNRLGYPM